MNNTTYLTMFILINIIYGALVSVQIANSQN